MTLQSRIFRIFISSTFGDLKLERDALQTYVFPKLRDLCAEHGCRFQAIDLRWGVSEEAALDQQTIPVCLEELRRCQRMTPRPNFIVLVGQRYGWRPLPAYIPVWEFEELERQIAASSHRALLREWYLLDHNAEPPQYCLKARHGEYEDLKRWEDVESRLHGLLLQGAVAADFPEEVRFKYESSATRQEIEAGALKSPNPANHVFGFFRSIHGLPTNNKDFLDLRKDDNGPDLDAQERLQQLKDKLEKLLPKANIKKYSTVWTGTGIADSHIAPLCADAYACLSQVICDEIEQLKKNDPIEEESAAHETFLADRVRLFTGRTELLHDINRYLRAASSTLLVVHGRSGCGKSTIMAKAGADARKAFPNAVTITRFIGATPSTTDARVLLDSLCRRLDRDYGHTGAVVPGEYKDLIGAFRQRLTLATKQKPLLLFLDALDQISDVDRGWNLMWLPTELPPNVRLVVSTLPGERLDILSKKLRSQSFVEVRPMPANEGRQLLRHWLREAQRTLQPLQRSAVVRGFRHSGLPLYLKLAFEEVRRWSSWQTEKSLPNDVIGIIQQLFQRLEHKENHGRIMVNRSLGYLAAARNGLTEDELLDVLSRDGLVLQDFQRRSPKSPVVDHLPFIIWSRLYADLEPYLTRRRGDGTSLFAFFHRQIGEQAAASYLSGIDKPSRHFALAKYFAEPTSAGWTLRALSELPYQLIQSARWADLRHTLSDFTFLEAKCKSGATYDLVADFNNAAKSKIPAGLLRQLNPFSRFVKANAHVLAKRPSLLLQQAANEPDSSFPGQTARQRLAGAAESAQWLRWINKPQKPSPCLMVLVGHVGDINGCGVSPDGSRLASAGRDQAIHIWDAATGTELLTLFGHRTPIATCAYSPDGCCVASGGYDGSLKLWDPLAGMELPSLAGHSNQIELCTFSADGKRLLSVGNDNTLRVWDVRRRKQIVARHLPETAMACAFSPDGKRFASGNQHGTLTLWDAVKYKRISDPLKAHDAEVMGCCFSPDGRWLFTTSQDKTIKRWRADLTGEPLVYGGHTDAVWTVAISKKRGLLASVSNDQTIKIWNLFTGDDLATFTGHTDGVLSCAFLPGDDRLVTSSWDGTVRIWDVSKINPARRIRRKPGIDPNDKTVWLTCGFSPDGKSLAAGSDNDLRLWDVETGTLREIFGPHSDFVRHISFSPYNQWVVASAGRKLYRWTRGGSQPRMLRSHRNLVSGCFVSPDGKRVLSSSEDRTLRITDVEDGKRFVELWRDKAALTCSAVAKDWSWAAVGTKDGRVRILSLPRGRKIAEIDAHSDEVTTMAVSPDGRWLATGSMDRQVKIWDSKGKAKPRILPDHSASILYCSFSPNGLSLATVSRDQTMKIWDVATGVCRQTLVGHSTAFQECSFSPDGSRIFTGSYDGTLRLWNAKRGSELTMLSGFRDSASACSFSPDGSRFASASHFRTIKLYDGQMGRELRRLIGHQAEVRDCAFSPDGKRLVSASIDSTVRLWNSDRGGCLAVLKGHRGPVQSCAFSPDGKIILSASWDRTLRLWDAENGNEIATLEGHRDWLQRAVFSPDGQKIVSSGLDPSLKLWTSTGMPIAELAGHEDAISFCSFSKDNNRLLSASADGRLKIWDADNGNELLDLCGHTGPVRGCSFSPSGLLAASGSMDRTVRLWDLQQAGQSTILGEHESWVFGCDFSPDGQWLVSGSHDGFVKLWNVVARKLECEYYVGAAVQSLRWHPSDNLTFLVGHEEGGVHLLRREAAGQGVQSLPQERLPNPRRSSMCRFAGLKT